MFFYYYNALVAQWTEHQTSNLLVPSSNLGEGAKDCVWGLRTVCNRGIVAKVCPTNKFFFDESTFN